MNLNKKKVRIFAGVIIVILVLTMVIGLLAPALS